MLQLTLAAFATVVLTGGIAAAQSSPPGGEGTAGPPYDYTTELMGQYTLIPLKDQAMITKTEHGYLYRAGQQDTHLVVTRTERGLRFADTGTSRFKRLTSDCRERKAEAGVVAVCSVPNGISTAEPLMIEIWPRLGDDFVDGSSLPATLAMTVLGDAGKDVALLGAGWDFFNGHTGRDRVWGGDGNDWIRTGNGPDLVHGGTGHDQLVGMDGDDTFYGDNGDDLLAGGDGKDRLDGGLGSDFVMCNAGVDTGWDDGDDHLRACETVIPAGSRSQPTQSTWDEAAVVRHPLHSGR